MPWTHLRHRHQYRLTASVALAVLLLASPPGLGQQAPAGLDDLVFVANEGQWAEGLFRARVAGGYVQVDVDGITLVRGRYDAEGRWAPVRSRLRFTGAAASLPTGFDRRPGRRHFLVGNDPARWRSDVPAWRGILYENLHPGIDVELSAWKDGLGLRLSAAPGAALEGVVVQLAGDEIGSVRLVEPPSHQGQPLGIEWHDMGSGHLRLSVPPHDPADEVIVDSGLEWSTFLNGDTGATIIEDVLLREDGSVVVVGRTSSFDYPTTPDAFDTSWAGGSGGLPSDGIVTAFDSTGSQLLFSTFIGGTNTEYFNAVAQNTSGDLVVAGQGASHNYPTTPGAFDTSFQSGGVVTCLVADGSALVWSTFLGSGIPRAMACLDNGDAVVAGIASFADHPTTPGAFDTSFNASVFHDGFLSRVSADGSSLVASTFLGGSSADGIAHRIGITAKGLITVAGATSSPDFPTTAGTLKPVFDGPDGFVVQFDPMLSDLVFSTFLGTGSFGQIMTLARDDTVLVAGHTSSDAFPTTPGAYDDTFNASFDGAIYHLSADGTERLAATYLGGFGIDHIYDIAVDSGGIVTVAGDTQIGFSSTFPTTPGALKTTAQFTQDIFVSRFDPTLSELYYSTLLGGLNKDGGGNSSPEGLSVALDGTGSAVVGHRTQSVDFPVTAGSFDTTHSGVGADGFVAKLSMLPTGVEKYGASTPGCGSPLALGVTSQPSVGNTTFRITCTGAPPSSTRGLLAVSAAGLARPVTAAGAEAWLDFAGLIALLPARSDELGFSVVPLRIPDRPALAGLEGYAQFFWPDACAPAGWSASNALVITVQP